MNFPSNYCAIKGTPCNRARECGETPHSVFLAYPFQPEFQAIASSFDELLKTRRRINLTPKPENAFAGYLFCDVICPRLLQSALFIGEISVPNRNVSLEIGYALGCGKKIFLAINDTYRTETNAFAESGLYLNYYKTAADLLRIIENGKSVPGETLANPLPNNEVNPVTLLMADPSSVHAPLKSRIESILISHGFSLIKPTGLGLNFERTFEVIRKSEWIVCHFVESNFPNHQVLNSTAAFFLGYSISQGKKVLVLQSLPEEKMMVDLAGIVEHFNRIDEIEQILKKRMHDSTCRIIPSQDNQLHVEELRDLARRQTGDALDTDFEKLGGIPKQDVVSSSSKGDTTNDTAKDLGITAQSAADELSLDELQLATDPLELGLDDDEFVLAPVDDDDSASQVIALDDSDFLGETSDIDLTETELTEFSSDRIQEKSQTTPPVVPELKPDGTKQEGFWARLFGRLFNGDQS